MSDNFFKNTFNKFKINFDFLGEKSIKQYGKTFKNINDSVWRELLPEKNDKVFSGDIAKEIKEKSRIAYNTASLIRENVDNTKGKKFDINDKDYDFGI